VSGNKKANDSQPGPSVSSKTKEDYLRSAKDMYLKALKLDPHCPYNNARCAKALWSMPVPYKDKERAKQAVLHALTLASDDSMVRKSNLNTSFMLCFLSTCVGP
jgi:hypothetical protein